MNKKAKSRAELCSGTGKKILVAMSGGVDSSVAAALLLRQGYEVAGAFMVNYDSADDGRFGECWRNDYRDAARVAAKLGIPLFKLDFKKEYEKKVLAYMFAEYKKGRTPNPDVLCNKFIKFGVWLEKAKELGFDKLATGHYARLGREIRSSKHEIRNKLQNPNYKLLEAKDKDKDQTYFLHQLNQEQLKYVLFPIGDYKKTEVRKIAKKFNLPTADRAESMGICFVGEVPMKEFLSKKIKLKKGDIISSTGEILGKHDGLAFYTIGQRHGFKAVLEKKGAESRPLYIVDKNYNTNELVVGFENDPLFYKKQAEAGEINWISGQKPKLPLKCQVRLRHRQPLQNVQLFEKNGKISIHFTNKQKAVTPGQFAVFYLPHGKNSVCLGGGVIK